MLGHRTTGHIALSVNLSCAFNIVPCCQMPLPVGSARRRRAVPFMPTPVPEPVCRTALSNKWVQCEVCRPAAITTNITEGPECTTRATSVNARLRLRKDLRTGSIWRDIANFPSELCRRTEVACSRK